MRIYSSDEKLPYPKNWPPESYHVNSGTVSAATQKAFIELLQAGANETVADTFIRKNPAFLGQCLNFTNFGHHGMWVVPQKLIDPGATPSKKGLRPDYLFGGKNSDGFYWCVAELKGPNARLFKRTRNGKNISFSETANQGVCQLLRYMDYCSANQSFFRDHFKLTDFREPRGFLIIGREEELALDEQLQELKSAWNRMSGGRIMIRSYDALLRSTASSWGEVEHGWALDNR
ncbi:Shedu anti-phage system protein SduA domain-containing protein [Pseudomonas sp. MWU12-2037]|uniref:Shedu anti-phage system protein SduA domain-containing protein n=1 Tax=Pseudomonas sp. MWU12-2037 TaxID=2928690 RepID=UPI00200E9969|nr:Shedu anti-phage system protein SduA domain-containing protein [Pseudomonas sp. MWU12-2037]